MPKLQERFPRRGRGLHAAGRIRNAALAAAMLAASATTSGCGEEQTPTPRQRALVAELCTQISQGEDARAKRESHAWCHKAYSDMSDAQVKDLLRTFRRIDRLQPNR
jgi:tellurite resistance protein